LGALGDPCNYHNDDGADDHVLDISKAALVKVAIHKAGAELHQ
jgi:hypothetical protein